jgi:hypothetical protein
MADIYAGLDLEFRPPERLFPMTAEKLLLSRVKGTWRREVLTMAVAEDYLKEVDPFFTRVSLEDEDRRARAAVHPTFMGGEYLPDFVEGEIEVARIDLRSITADAISIRLRRIPTGFTYRVVDEYMDENEDGLLEAPTTVLSDVPLNLAEFGTFVVRTSRLKEICDTDRFDSVDEAQAFVYASSEFYPEFSAYITATIASLHPVPDLNWEDEAHG